MPEGYLHLTCEQRCQIYALLQSGHSQAHIARQIGVDPSTISRELVRNTGARGYRFKQAHEKASQRRQKASDKPRKMTPDLVELIEEKLTQEQWSPDQISGRLAKDGVAFISHERIYQHVWKDKKDGGTLYLHLRHSGKKYNRRKGKNSGAGSSEPRRYRSAASYCRRKKPHRRLGGRHDYRRQSQRCCDSHVERTSKDTKLAKLPDKNADFVVQACARVLLPLADQIETIITTMEKSSPLTPKSQPRWGHYPILPSPITRGNAASTNTLTASSGSTSQKVPTSLFCPMPTSKGSRTNSISPQKELGYQTPRDIFFSARNLPVALHC